jgi:myo-inositol-1(or 4)-monophosphatase
VGLSVPALDHIIEIAHTAGERIVALRNNHTVNFKASNNLVTEADLQAEKIIIDALHEAYPADSFLAEESSQHFAQLPSRLWIIDPLDGTNNYAHGIPQYCVSIAFALNGTVECGVVYDPVHNETFTAVRGKEARCNGKSIHVSRAGTLQESVIGTGFYYDRGEIMRKTLKTIEVLFEHNIQGIRRIGSAALDICWVACGRFDGYFEYHLSPWDYAAAALIAQQAGAGVYGPDGNTLQIGSNGVICATPAVAETLCQLVRWDR